MKTKKLNIFLLFTLLIMIAFTGCGRIDSDVQTSSSGRGKTAETSQPAAGGSDAKNSNSSATESIKPENTGQDKSTDNPLRTVTDIFGRKVAVPEEIHSAAALGGSARLIVYAGGTSKITGVTEMEKKGEPGMPYAYANKDYFSKCPALASGGSGNADYTEAIIELNPDVIFYNDSDTAAMEDLAGKTKIPVIGVYGDAFNSDVFLKSLTLIGDVLGTSEHAEYVVNKIRGWIKDLDERTNDIPDTEKPVVYTGGVNWNGAHGFTGTYVKYAPFTAINALNPADELQAADGVDVSMEQILSWDPDIIFLNPQNMDLINEEYEKNPAAIDSLKAVKEGSVYPQINFNYYWCNMELAIVDSYYAGTIIYPDRFSDISFEEKAEEIFNTMIGMDYLEVLKENGMEFKKLDIGK